MQKSSDIYLLIDPRDRAVRYVGQSIDAKTRYWRHCVPSNPGITGPWIRELRVQGLRPILQIAEKVIGSNCNKYDEREQHWIQFYLNKGEPLLNLAIYPNMGRESGLDHS